jgi:CxxC motif-containing protein (DUF1111 family)
MNTVFRVSRLLAAAFFLSALFVSCTDPVSDSKGGEGDDVRSGGNATIFDATSQAFALPMPNLAAASFERHAEGDAAFEATFVTSPAVVNAGLGPVYNNTSCIGCHPRDGRGRPPVGNESLSSMLFRISVPGVGPHGGPMPAPGFGGQLQDRAVHGTPPEGTVAISYVDLPGTFADGEEYHLRKPLYTITSSYIPVPAGMMLSPRVAPPVFGLGLLEAVPDAVLLGLADEHDQNGDGISGRPNRVWHPLKGEQLGRFGWKAGAPDLDVQTAGAYNEDMGVTSGLFPFESCHGQTQYPGDVDLPDIDEPKASVTAHYVRTLAVPARRHTGDSKVIAGGRIFREAGCNGCHVVSLTTGSGAGMEPAVTNQTIHPYTDLLLHDMGEGLADGRPDYLAGETEWRTSPLWGIGLTQIVNGHTLFLHDGRARNLMEAILWHGGEAENAREHVRNLKREDRDALIAFLNSL